METLSFAPKRAARAILAAVLLAFGGNALAAESEETKTLPTGARCLIRAEKASIANHESLDAIRDELHAIEKQARNKICDSQDGNIDIPEKQIIFCNGPNPGSIHNNGGNKRVEAYWKLKAANQKKIDRAYETASAAIRNNLEKCMVASGTN